MKYFTLICLLMFSHLSWGQVSFEDYFEDRTLRFDFMFAGNSKEIEVLPLEFKAEPLYGGSLTNLVDPFNYGNIRYEVRDTETGTLIFSRGYGTLFQEWQTTDEATKINRSFYEVIKFPFPKKSVELRITKFEKDGTYSEVYSRTIDPDNYFIRNEPVNTVNTFLIRGGNDPHKSVDLAFIAEGYTSEEMGKFRKDAERMADIILSTPPYDEFTDRINIWGIGAVSEESGTDIPGERIYRNTALNSSFYTFDLARYLTTFDIKTVNDYAACVPHDNIIIIINSERYGGGGMYNYYSCSTADNTLTPKVLTHEFGHGFAGLADEYYTSDVAYNEFYPLGIEPWEPNITTLVDFNRKWEKMIDKNTPVPTPATDEYKDIVGLFEGAGYSAKGIYRPQTDCRMKSNNTDGFCEVCKEAIRKMIRFYTE